VDDRPARRGPSLYSLAGTTVRLPLAGSGERGLHTRFSCANPQTNQAVVVPLTSGERAVDRGKRTDSMVTTSDVTVAGDHTSTTAGGRTLPSHRRIEPRCFRSAATPAGFGDPGAGRLLPSPVSLEAMVDPALDGERGIPAAQAGAGLPEVEKPVVAF